MLLPFGIAAGVVWRIVFVGKQSAKDPPEEDNEKLGRLGLCIPVLVFVALVIVLAVLL